MKNSIFNLHLLNQQMVPVHKLFECALDMVDKVKQNHWYKYHHLQEHFVVAKIK
jgi:hypothetical protein